jgi:hypothetical protein
MRDRGRQCKYRPISTKQSASPRSLVRPTGGWTYQSDTEILFPMRVAPQLRDLRGRVWQDLVERAVQAADGSLDQLAFSLLLIRLAGCITCHTDSYRGMRGCSVCASTVIRRYRGNDNDLLAQYQRARDDVAVYLPTVSAPAAAG